MNFRKKFSIAKIFPLRFLGIFVNIYPQTISPVYSIYQPDLQKLHPLPGRSLRSFHVGICEPGEERDLLLLQIIAPFLFVHALELLYQLSHILAVLWKAKMRTR